MEKSLKDKIWEKLKDVLDPEIRISIVDLGLIYQISEVKDGTINIKMTLTSSACPFFGLIKKEIKNKLSEIKEIKKVKVKLTFDPPWSPEKLSEKAKAHLDFLR